LFKDSGDVAQNLDSARFDLLLAVDAGARWFMTRDVAPDYAVGDFDSIDADTLAWLQASDTRFQHASADKDFSDLELALRVCEAQEVQTATIMGAVGGRLDHQLCVLGALHKSSVPNLRLLGSGEGCQVICLLRAGQQHMIEGEGTIFSVIGLQKACVSITGARWPLDHVMLDGLSAHGLSNECTSEEGAIITAHHGSAFVISQQQKS